MIFRLLLALSVCFLSTLCVSRNLSNASDVTTTIHRLQWKDVCFVGELRRRKKVAVARESWAMGIVVSFRMLAPWSPKDGTFGSGVDSNVVFFLDGNVTPSTAWGEFVETVERCDPDTVILVTDDSVGEVDLFHRMADAEAVGFFHLVDSRLHRFQTFTDRRSYAYVEWFLDEDTGYFRPDFSLAGAGVRVAVSDWYPQVMLSPGCYEGGSGPCTWDGLGMGVMEALAERQNFTFTVNGEKVSHEAVGSECTGVLAKTSTSWLNVQLAHRLLLQSIRRGDWVGVNGSGGIFGSVVQNTFDVSPGIWMTTLERADYVDFVPVLPETASLLINSGHWTGNDFDFFLRPLRWDTLVTTLAVGSVLFLAQTWILSRRHEGFLSSRLAIVFWGIFFLLVDIFYEGSLTMFLTSSVEQRPFDNIWDGLAAYPTLKMLCLRGMEILLEHMAKLEGKEELVVEYLKAAEELDLYVDTPEEGIEKLRPNYYFLGQMTGVEGTHRALRQRHNVKVWNRLSC